MVVGASALLTVLALDLAIASLVPHPAAEYDVDAGVRDYRQSDPHVLILGSSYVRSFLPMREQYARGEPPFEIAIIAVEGGKLNVLDWILQQRLLPLIDETGPEGKPLRRNLRHIVLQTNFYDLCGDAADQGNLPSRAWRLSDYLRDIAEHGVTAFNENYVDSRWKAAMGWSILVSDRGFFRIIPYLRQRIGHGADEAARRGAQARLENWIGMIESHHPEHASCLRNDQQAALESILDTIERRTLSASVLLWPVIPKAHTAQSLAVTQAYRDYIERSVRPHQIPVADLQAERVLLDEHFRPDLDHLTEEGDRLASRWATRSLIDPIHQRWLTATTGRAP